MDFVKDNTIFKVNASAFKKQITELKIVKVNPKTLTVIGDNGESRVPMRFFDDYQEGVIYDSFVQYTHTIEEADLLSITLMDRVIAGKLKKKQGIQDQISNALVARNSAPTIRRIQE